MFFPWEFLFKMSRRRYRCVSIAFWNFSPITEIVEWIQYCYRNKNNNVDKAEKMLTRTWQYWFIPKEHRVYRVPGFQSSRPNWSLLHRKRVCLPLGPKEGEQHSLAGQGWGTQFERLDRKPGTLYSYTLCKGILAHFRTKQMADFSVHFILNTSHTKNTGVIKLYIYELCNYFYLPDYDKLKIHNVMIIIYKCVSSSE